MAVKIALAETKLAACGRCAFMRKTVKLVSVHVFYCVTAVSCSHRYTCEAWHLGLV